MTATAPDTRAAKPTVRVVITGAAGNLGGKIRAHLEALDGWELILLDAEPRGDAAIHAADLAVWDGAWVDRFRGIDGVLHLAADNRSSASWQSLEKHNVDALLNVLEASVAGGVRRFVFASSSFVLAGYRDRDEPLTPDLNLRPETLYGVTKAMGERLCRHAAERHGLSVVCLRIGAVSAGDNDPRALGDDGWRRAWLSNRDWCQVAEKALSAPDLSFAVVNAMSDNAGMRWDLGETRRLLGYVPSDSWRPVAAADRQAGRLHHKSQPLRTSLWRRLWSGPS